MKRLAVVAAAALLAGCSGNAPPSTQTVRASTSVSSSGTPTQSIESYQDVGGSVVQVGAAPDRVWEMLPAVYQGLGITVGTTIPDAKTIGNLRLELNRTLGGQPLSTYVNCGEGATGTPLADSYRVTLSVLTTLTPGQNGGTRVETRVAASAANRAVSGATVNCGTTGRLEGLIADRVKNQTA